jgi:hypoxanthine phosphoribosyltransferase
MSAKTDYSWNDIVSLCKHIADAINASGDHSPISCIWAIPRGALVPARILSELLDVKKIVTNIRDVDDDDGIVLIVDDISDSGKTLVRSVNKFQDEYGLSYKVATLFVRDGTHYEPDFYGERLHHDKWIEFPWEAKVLARELDTTHPEQDD